MRQSLWLRLNGLSITVLYEGGGRQQVTIPGPCSGRVQRWKEIPEAMKKKDKDNKYKERGGKEDNKRNIEGNEKLKGERMHVCCRN